MSPKRVFILLMVFTGLFSGFPAAAEDADAEANPSGLYARIIDVYAGIPLIDAGSEEGVLRGDEFIVEAPAERGGYVSGLLVVRRADENVSEVILRYGEGKQLEGTRVKKLRRWGFETMFFGRYTQTVYDSDILEGKRERVPDKASTGVEVLISRRVYSMRPLIGVEYPLNATALRLYAGGELNWFYRRLSVTPAGGIGVEGLFSGSDRVGGICRLSLGLLISRDIRLELEFGGAAWKGLRSKKGNMIEIFTGLGASIKG